MMKRVLVCVSLWAGCLLAGCVGEEDAETSSRDDDPSGLGAPRSCEQVFTCARDGATFQGDVFGEETPAQARLACREHCGQGCEEGGLSCLPQPEK